MVSAMFMGEVSQIPFGVPANPAMGFRHECYRHTMTPSPATPALELS